MVKKKATPKSSLELLREHAALSGLDLSDEELIDRAEELRSAAYLEVAMLEWNLPQARIEIERRKQLDALDALPGDSQVDLKALLARRLKELRVRSRRTQDELAQDMQRLGFVTWKRITVAETESEKRRPSWEELFGFAVLFGVTVADLLAGDVRADEAVVLNERIVMNASTTSLLAGLEEVRLAGIQEVRATADNTVGARVIGVEPGSPEDWRPAVDLQPPADIKEI